MTHAPGHDRDRPTFPCEVCGLDVDDDEEAVFQLVLPEWLDMSTFRQMYEQAKGAGAEGPSSPVWALIREHGVYVGVTHRTCRGAGVSRLHP
jgi:hypothetical protein